MLYLAVARQVTFYGRTLLVRSPHEEACRELAVQLADSPTEQLDLEFDVISVIRYFPAHSQMNIENIVVPLGEAFLPGFRWCTDLSMREPKSPCGMGYIATFLPPPSDCKLDLGL